AKCYQTDEKIEIIQQTLYHYQQHPTSLTHSEEHLQEKKYRTVVEKIKMIPFSDEKVQKAVNQYLLLLISQGLPPGKSSLLDELLLLNHKKYWVKHQGFYRYYWQIKLFYNRLMRKLFHIPMAWK
ncbi:MAG: hypothetical protein ACRCWD_05120, partial [Culicoidibacterales bacterium]